MSFVSGCRMDTHQSTKLFHLFAYLCLGLICANQPLSAQTADQEPVISGSRLLTPGSYGLEIPTAKIEPTDLELVETQDDSNQQVVAKVHVKVGDNYVVMLPDGRLVGRMADQVKPTDQPFKAASHRDIGNELKQQLSNQFSGFRFEKSKHYVYVYNASGEFKNATKRILETMYNGVKAYANNMGVETHHADVPLVVIMFRTRREFDAYRSMHPSIMAYYEIASNHIVLCQESPLADSRPDLAIGQLLSTIAHEGAHQILHNIGVQQRLSVWPIWLSEGLAEFFAPTSFGNRNRWKGAGDVNDLRMFELETFLQTQFIKGFDGSTIQDFVVAPTLDSTGYAGAWGMVHYLADQKRKAFHSYVQQMSKLGPLKGMVARPEQPVVANLEHFQAMFGGEKSMLELENDMVKYLSKLDYDSPVGSFVHYVGMARVPTESGEKKYACFFANEKKVEDWKNVLLETLSPQQLQAAKWEVSKTRNRAAANSLISKFLK